jgi:hypothetical protein
MIALATREDSLSGWNRIRIVRQPAGTVKQGVLQSEIQRQTGNYLVADRHMSLNPEPAATPAMVLANFVYQCPVATLGYAGCNVATENLHQRNAYQKDE